MGGDRRIRRGIHTGIRGLGVLDTGLGRGHRVRIIPEILFRYRIREGSMRKGSDRPENRAPIMRALIEKHADLFRQNVLPALIGRERIVGELKDFCAAAGRGEAVVPVPRSGAPEANCAARGGWTTAGRRGARPPGENRAPEGRTLRAGGTAVAPARNPRSEGARVPAIVGSKGVEARLRLPGGQALPAGGPSPAAASRRLRVPGLHQALRRKNAPDSLGTGAERLVPVPAPVFRPALPPSVKARFPTWPRNAACAVFRTTDERLFRQKRWDGPLVTVVIPATTTAGSSTRR